MGNWFNDNKVGLTMGIWAGNCNLGDIVGLLIGSLIVN